MADSDHSRLSVALVDVTEGSEAEFLTLARAITSPPGARMIAVMTALADFHSLSDAVRFV